MSKIFLSSIALAGVVLSLVACSGTTEGADGDCSATPSGASSDKVEVSGTDAQDMEVNFASPLTATTTERTVVEDGDGEGIVAVDGSSVTVDIKAFNATSGDAIDQLTADDETLQLEEPLLAGLIKAVTCSAPGARIAAVIPPADAFGDEGQEQLGLSPSDSMVLVIDVVEVAEPVEALPRADGEDQPAEEGFPTVELGEDGNPTVTIPDAPAPTELGISVLKQGDGTEVAEGDNVTVHYRGVVWETGETFDSSWDRGEPASFPTDGVIEGFSAALVGQNVGSQVIAVIPPAQGYGDSPPEGSPITATSTLVFVVDILATQ